MKNLHTYYSTLIILLIGILGEKMHLERHTMKISLSFYLLGIPELQ